MIDGYRYGMYIYPTTLYWGASEKSNGIHETVFSRERLSAGFFQ